MLSNVNRKFEFMSLAYEVHSSPFQHYSSLIVKARISIMTLIILAFSYILGVFHTDIDKQIFWNISIRSIISYLASFLIVCLFVMETHYCRRLLQIISVSKTIEKKLDVKFFFNNYDRATRWPLYVLYGLAIIFLDIFSLVSAVIFEGKIWDKYFLFLLLPIPIGLYVYGVKKIHKESKAYVEENGTRK